MSEEATVIPLFNPSSFRIPCGLYVVCPYLVCTKMALLTSIAQKEIEIRILMSSCAPARQLAHTWGEGQAWALRSCRLCLST